MNNQLGKYAASHQESIFELLFEYLRVRPIDIRSMIETPDEFFMDVNLLYADEFIPCPRSVLSRIMSEKIVHLYDCSSYFTSRCITLIESVDMCATGLHLLSMLIYNKHIVKEERVKDAIWRTINRVLSSDLSDIECSYIMIMFRYNSDYFTSEYIPSNFSRLLSMILHRDNIGKQSYKLLYMITKLFLEMHANNRSQIVYDILDSMPNFHTVYRDLEGISCVILIFKMCVEKRKERSGEGGNASGQYSDLEMDRIVVGVRRELMNSMVYMMEELIDERKREGADEVLDKIDDIVTVVFSDELDKIGAQVGQQGEILGNQDEYVVEMTKKGLIAGMMKLSFENSAMMIDILLNLLINHIKFMNTTHQDHINFMQMLIKFRKSRLPLFEIETEALIIILSKKYEGDESIFLAFINSIVELCEKNIKGINNVPDINVSFAGLLLQTILLLHFHHLNEDHLKRIIKMGEHLVFLEVATEGSLSSGLSVLSAYSLVTDTPIPNHIISSVLRVPTKSFITARDTCIFSSAVAKYDIKLAIKVSILSYVWQSECKEEEEVLVFRDLINSYGGSFGESIGEKDNKRRGGQRNSGKLQYETIVGYMNKHVYQPDEFEYIRSIITQYKKTSSETYSEIVSSNITAFGCPKHPFYLFLQKVEREKGTYDIRKIYKIIR